MMMRDDKWLMGLDGYSFGKRQALCIRDTQEIIGTVFARSQGVERAAKTRRMGLALFSPLQTLCAGRVKHIESTNGLANIFC